jgi:hypothetical protein
MMCAMRRLLGLSAFLSMVLLVTLPLYKPDNADSVLVRIGRHGFHVYYVVIAMLWMVLPLTWYLLRCRDQAIRRHRQSNSRCPACGYDLRASPQQCPECGAD